MFSYFIYMTKFVLDLLTLTIWLHSTVSIYSWVNISITPISTPVAQKGKSIVYWKTVFIYLFLLLLLHFQEFFFTLSLLLATKYLKQIKVATSTWMRLLTNTELTEFFVIKKDFVCKQNFFFYFADTKFQPYHTIKAETQWLNS